MIICHTLIGRAINRKMSDKPNNAARQKREELADFLKTRRAVIQPSEVGLPESPRKRTPGLRREDVAELADLSVSWYSWLEQARDINPSDESLNAIADALQLNNDERLHLFRLAKTSGEYVTQNEINLTEIKRVLNSFASDIPATATGRYMNILAWNKAAGELYDDFKILPATRMNWAWYVFKYKSREFFADWDTFARCTLAVVRNDYGKYVGTDAEGTNLIKELRRENPLFDQWWQDHEVISVPHPNKEFVHATQGKLRYVTSAMHLESAPEVRFVIYTPLG